MECITVPKDKFFITSDTHFFHENIIKLARRPFSCASEMNEEMIRRWNDKISHDSLVIIAGDFAWKNNILVPKLLKRLNGFKRLVIGNHDSNSAIENFEFVYDMLRVNIEDEKLYSLHISHYPLESWFLQYRNGIHLHGHTHRHAEDKQHERKIDIGVDGNDFTPYSWNDIKKLINDIQ